MKDTVSTVSMNLPIEITLSDDDVNRIAIAIAELLRTTISTTASQNQLLSEKDAARQLGVSPHTLKKWRQRGQIKSSTITRPILYSQRDIAAAVAWLTDRGRQKKDSEKWS